MRLAGRRLAESSFRETMGQRALDVHPDAVAEIRAARLRYAQHSAERDERDVSL